MMRMVLVFEAEGTSQIWMCPECDRIFYRNRKQIYCSKLCTDRVARREWLKKPANRRKGCAVGAQSLRTATTGRESWSQPQDRPPPTNQIKIEERKQEWQKIKLTANNVETLKAKNGRRTDYWDEIQRGLALRISPSGKKTWVAFLPYRPPISPADDCRLSDDGPG